MKLGNIVYDSELVNHDTLDYINYYDNIFNENIDYNLPTLFVGWINLKNSFVDKKFDILNKEIIKNKQYWEFSFNENKASHVNGVIDFVEALPKYFFEGGFEYENIDPIFSNIRELDKLLTIIPETIDSYYNYCNESIFLLSENKIFGLDLRMFNFFNINYDEIINAINTRTLHKYNDIDGEIYRSYYRLIPNYINLRRYIVCLMKK